MANMNHAMPDMGFTAGHLGGAHQPFDYDSLQQNYPYLVQ